MPLINTTHSGQFASVQPLIVNGAVVVGAAIAPQETLVGGNGNVTFEGSPIETTGMTNAVTISHPSAPGAATGTTNAFAKTISGFSKKVFIGGKNVVTSGSIKIINAGNCPSAPMVATTKAKTVCTIGE
jgi:hypothetical protein